MELENSAVADASIYLPPLSSPAKPARHEEEPHEQVLDERLLLRLLKMADNYQATGALRQAVEMYFQLVEGYAATPQAAQAYERLLAIGDAYEENGELRQARAIFERLL